MTKKDISRKGSSIESVLSDQSSDKKHDSLKSETAGEKIVKSGSRGRCELIGLAMCMILDPQILYGEFHVHYLRGSSDMAYVFFTFVLVMPIMFVQLFLGQYTQLCCLHLGKMVPLIHGLGLVMVIMNLYSIIIVLENSDLCLHYLFLSFNEPWKYCAETPDCVPFPNILSCTGDDCLEVEYGQLSGYLYYREKRRYRSPEMIIYIILIAAIVCGVSMLGYRRYRILIKITLLSVVIITLILIFTVLSLTSYPREIGYGVRKSSLSVTHTTVQGFSESISRSLLSIHMASAAYMLYGTYLPSTYKSNICSFVVCALYIMFIGFGAIFLRLCYYAILNATNTTKDVLITGMETLFVVVPEYLGSLHISPLFVLGFYWTCFILTITKLVLHTDIISDTIIGYFPKAFDYRIYIILCIIIAAILGTIPYMIVRDGFVPELMKAITDFTSLIVLEIELSTIMYIYSYTIFSDDIHFAYGSQPATLWKVIWIICPLILFIALLVYHDDRKYTLPFILIVVATILPIVIGALYKLVKAIRVHNTLDFLMPDDTWGMKDPFMCKLRNIYNPRDEIHSQRKVDECKHECLVGSEILSSMIRTEIDINLTVKMEKRVPRTEEEEGELEDWERTIRDRERDTAQFVQGESSNLTTKEDVDKFYEELLQKYGIELE